MSTQYIGEFSVGETVDRGIRMFKETPRIWVPFMLLGTLIGIIMLPVANAMAVSIASGNYFSMGLVAYVLIIIAGIWLQLVLVRGMLQFSKTGEIKPFESLLKTVGFKEVLRAVFGISTVTLIVLFSGFLLLVPAIFLGNYLPMYYVKSIDENKYNLGQFGNAMELQKGRWWPSFGLYIILYFVYFVFAMIGYVPGIVFGVGEEMLLPGDFSVVSTLFSAIPFVLGYFAFIPCVCAVIVHYHSLRTRKLGARAELDIENLGESESAGGINPAGN